MTGAIAGAYGPLWRINGPLPQPPRYTLLNAGEVVDDVDAAQVDRWINGIKVYPYPCNLADVWLACAGSPANKQTGVAVPLPEFGAFTTILGETCSTTGIAGPGLSPAEMQARFFDRVSRSFAAVEAQAVEAEFLTGTLLPGNPHLDNGLGTFPWGSVATTVQNGVACLEQAISKSGKRGMIHVSAAVATVMAANRLLAEPSLDAQRLTTRLGTIVVPGYGYTQTLNHPDGMPAPANALQEWIYATGMVEIRRSELVMLPEQIDQAIDRGTNTITYAAERYYVVDWDTCVQASVLVDRCATTCGTPPS